MLLSVHVFVYLCVTVHRCIKTNTWNKLAVFRGALWLLWACYLGYDFWQELGYWLRFVKWYNHARFFPFTPLRPHLTFRSDCKPLSMYAFRHKPHTHTLHPLQMLKDIDFFFLHISAHYVFLVTCQSKSVLIEWPFHPYLVYLCVDVSRLSLLQWCG